MQKELKTIVESCGKEIFLDADRLMQFMQQSGCEEKDIMTVGLILKTCPSVGAILAQDEVSQAEINMLVTAAVSTSGLSVHAVRSTLGKCMGACGISGAWVPYLLINEPQPEMTLKPMMIDEDDTLEDLEARLGLDEVRSEIIHDLDVLSSNGNIRASYSLGKFYKPLDEKFHSTTGKEYFQRAAAQGYGPANGALADYLIRSDRKSMARAAKYFENPTTLAGHDGREWVKLSSQLLNYREENARRINSLLIMQIVMLVMSVLTLCVGLVGIGVFSIGALVVQVGSLAWTLFMKFFGPYYSCRNGCFATIASWLVLVLGML